MFTNAKTVMIGNKEVKSIVTSNGGVLYERKGYGLSLTSDKSSLSTNESATLTATLTNNYAPVVNETIYFCGITSDTPTAKTLSANVETPVGCKYAFASIPSLNNGEYIYLDKEHRIKLARDAYGATGIFWSLSDYGQGNGSCLGISSVIVENNIIKVTYSGLSTTIDASRCDMSAILSDISGVTINDYGISVATNSNGEATVTYSPTSTGNKIITAKWDDLSDSVQLTVT